MTLSPTIPKAPRGQTRVVEVDRDTGATETRDFWSEHEARGYIYEVEDDRPWITYHVYNDEGQEL